MTTKVKIWSRQTKEKQMEQVNEFLSTIPDDKIISANLTGDQGVMVVYRD